MPDRKKTEKKYSAAQLREFSNSALTAMGIPEAHAHATTHILVTSNLRGVDSHGVRLLGGIHRRISSGGVNVDPAFNEISGFGGTSVLDGDDALGYVVGTEAMRRAIARARAAGIGMVAARNGGHYGAAAPYALMAVECDMLGISMSSTGPTMAVHGSVSRSIGNNPIAFACPGPDFPLALDFATSIASWGKVGTHRHLGLPIPQEWFVGKDGGPVEAGKDAVARAVGGAKGSGLAIFIEILSALLSGGQMLTEQGSWSDSQKPERSCHTMIAVDIARFLSLEQFIERVGELARELKSADKAPDVDEILMPGERAWKESVLREKEGIPINESIRKQLNELAEKIGSQPLT